MLDKALLSNNVNKSVYTVKSANFERKGKASYKAILKPSQ